MRAALSRLRAGRSQGFKLQVQTTEEEEASWVPKKGDYVFAKLEDWTGYYGGEIKKVNAKMETYEILFDDGERHKNVLKAFIRKSEPPSTPNPSAAMPPGAAAAASALAAVSPPSTPRGTISGRFKEGDRVSCKIAGWVNWYDGYITSANPDGTFVVSFDDGEVVSTVQAKEMMKVLTKGDEESLEPLKDYCQVNSRVEAKCPGWHKFYAGTVQDIDESRTVCTILFDDGELKEGITASMMRAARTKSQMKLRFDLSENAEEIHGFKVGMRVVANPFSEWTKAYPGRIERKLNDGTFAILFDDGERVAGVSAEDMHPERDQSMHQAEGPSLEEGNEEEYEYSVGQHIEAKVGQWRKYYPGRIRKENVDGTFVVDFLDGEVVHHVKPSEMRKSRQRTETTASERTSKANSPDEVFQPGERVAAKLFVDVKWRRYWGGEVVRCNPDGSYKIAFDDGEVYGTVWPEEMKRPKPGSTLAAPILKAPPPESFDVGERVEVKTMNWKSWYPGLIEKRNPENTYLVQFDDGERLFDIPVNEIRRLIMVRPDDDESSSDEEN